MPVSKTNVRQLLPLILLVIGLLPAITLITTASTVLDLSARVDGC